VIRSLVAMVAGAAVVLLAACHGGDDWNPDAQFAPSLRPAFGARVTDGKLEIWTGSRCVGVTRLALTFEPDDTALVLTAPSERPATVEHLTVGGPYPGLAVTEPLPAEFNWRDKESVRISVYGAVDGWGSDANIAEITEGSSQHPGNAYLFQGVGWLNAADVAAQDGKTFLATCTADPVKK
jgi:hypothetical protein